MDYAKNLNTRENCPILKQEWATLEAERKTLYCGYRELKVRRMELCMAKDNVERFLGIN